MNDRITLDTIEEHLQFFAKMYAVVRLVDPVEKRVVEYRNSAACPTDEICYQYWQQGHICDNCISIRAHSHNRSFFKLERTPDAIMMVTAIPVDTYQKPMVLELLKDATDSLLVGTGTYQEGELMHNMICKMNDMIVRDPLTGLYNRRFIEDRLPADLVRATLEDKLLSVIFIDIDNLKSINDAHGHSAGDHALQAVAGVISRCIRTQTDWAARYGGDEFLVCINHTTQEEAHLVEQRIRAALKSEGITIGGHAVHFHASTGLQTARAGTLTAQELIAMADARMYEDKVRQKQKKIAEEDTD